jgi:hypothetical protein
MEEKNPGADEGVRASPQETSVFSGEVFGDKTFRFRHVLAVVVLLALHWAMAVSSATQKSNVFDEIAHLTSGVANWKYNDYRLNPEGGTIAQRWAALPVLLGSYTFVDLSEPVWRAQRAWSVGQQFFFSLGNDLNRMLLESRAMIALLSVALGVLLYLWSRQLFGAIGGLLSLVVYTFSPTMLAHSRFVTTDLCTTLLFWLTLGCVWLIMHRLTLLRIVGLSLATTGLVLSKMSGVLILLIAVGLLGARIAVGRPLIMSLYHGGVTVVTRRWAQACILLTVMIVCGLLVWGGMWAAYGFRFSAAAGVENPSSPAYFNWDRVMTEGVVFKAVNWTRKHRLLPEAYLFGFAYTQRDSRVRESFLNGEVSLTGWRSFFPCTFLYKTPLPTMLLLLLSLAALFDHWRRQRQGTGWEAWRKMGADVYALLPVLLFIGIYGGVAITSRINIGHRHILPIYPAVFILIGAAQLWLGKPGRYLKTVVTLALAALMIESVMIWPHYLEYFNVFSGGPSQGYRRLVDSSLDWGQDLPSLRQWIEEKGLDRPGGEPVFLSYFGNAMPSYFGVNTHWIPGFPLPNWRMTEPLRYYPGYYCISATILQSLYLPMMGPWCEPYEEWYTQIAEPVNRLLETSPGSAERRALIETHGMAYWKPVLARYNILRFQRLCAYLRQKEPDDRIAYSILVYHLSLDELRQALHGPPAELYDRPRIKGLDEIVLSKDGTGDPGALSRHRWYLFGY